MWIWQPEKSPGILQDDCTFQVYSDSRLFSLAPFSHFGISHISLASVQKPSNLTTLLLCLPLSINFAEINKRSSSTSKLNLLQRSDYFSGSASHSEYKSKTLNSRIWRPERCPLGHSFSKASSGSLHVGKLFFFLSCGHTRVLSFLGFAVCYFHSSVILCPHIPRTTPMLEVSFHKHFSMKPFLTS